MTRSDSARPAQAADTRAAAAAQVRHLDNNRDPRAAARTRPTGYAYATLKRYTQTLHKAQDSVIGGMAEYEIEDRRVRREQKIRLVNV
jgi:hypothetical protein